MRGPFYCHIDLMEQPDGPSLHRDSFHRLAMPAFALRGRPWCRAHADPHQRERNADTREIIARIQYMNIFSIACTLQNTVYELRAKLIPPLQVEAIPIRLQSPGSNN